MKLLKFILALVVIHTLPCSAQVKLKDQNGKEYNLEVLYDDPTVSPKYIIHVFQPNLVVAGESFFFAPNLGGIVNVNDKLTLNLDFAPSIGPSNVSIKNAPAGLQSKLQWANQWQIGGAYSLFQNIVEKSKNVVIGGGTNVTVTTKMPLKKLRSLGIGVWLHSISSTPSEKISREVPAPNNSTDFETLYLTNRNVMSLCLGPAYTAIRSYHVNLDGKSFIGFSQNEIRLGIGTGLGQTYELYDELDQENYTPATQSQIDDVVKASKGLAWQFGINSVRYRPEATLCKYYNLGINFGAMPSPNFSSGRVGFFSFHFGYSFGQEMGKK